MTIYIGVDFHARSQTVAWCDTSNGEIQTRTLHHQKDDVRGFYAQFNGEVIVGIEASGYSSWFEELLLTLGHQSWIGDAAEIRRRARRRQKNDRRDAELILELLLRSEFPRVYRPSLKSREVLRLLRYRSRLVKFRTMVKNSLHAIALSAGVSLRRRLTTRAGRESMQTLTLSPGLGKQREEWLSLMDELQRRITDAETILQQHAEGDQRVTRLQTHPGLGLLTSLALVHTLGPVNRFSSSRKVTAYIGLEPREHSSGEKQKMLGISKAGSRLLRFLLGEAAHSAIKGDEELKRFYCRLVHRCGPQKATIAVARKLLIRAYILLRDEIDYHEFLRRGVAAGPARVQHRPIDA